MLNVWEAIEARRSIRKFSSDEVPQEMIDQMLEAARLAPSGGNVQPWRFMVVRDPDLKQKLREVCMEQRFIEEVPVVIICFGDLSRYSPDAVKSRRQAFEDSGVLATLSGLFADPDYRARMQTMPTPSREQLIPGMVSNSYIAIEHLVIMAAALGLSTCWVGGFDRDGLKQLLGFDDTLVPIAVLPVGYPDGKLPPPRPRLSIEEITVALPVLSPVESA